jgi:hypothetical protein
MLKSAKTDVLRPKCLMKTPDRLFTGAPSTRWFHGLLPGKKRHEGASFAGSPIATVATAIPAPRRASAKMIGLFQLILAPRDARGLAGNVRR